MSRKSQALDLAVKVAVDATCQRLGMHAACPIAQALVEMAVDRSMEAEQKRPTGAGDRQERAVRPEAKRDQFTELVPEEAAFKFPDVVPPVHLPGVRRAIVRGMAAHVAGARGAPVGAGGRVVQSIARRVATGGRARREDQRGSDLGFVPGESGF